MADIPTVSYDETKPAGTRDVNLGDNDICELKTQIREVIGQDHKMESSGQASDWGFHNFCTLLVQTTITLLANAFKLYSKDVSTKAELHGKDEDGNEIQITSGGKILGDNVRLSNNANLTAKDAAGTGTVNLIKANASDKVEIPDAAVLASSAAPTVDAAIANKKYVDDQLDTIVPVALGTWASKTVTTIYQAATDGFVLVYGTASNNGYINILTDSNATPSTTRARSGASTESGGPAYTWSLMCPVKNNDYYNVTVSGNGSTTAIYWIPLS
jgi:hypothetical protein